MTHAQTLLPEYVRLGDLVRCITVENGTVTDRTGRVDGIQRSFYGALEAIYDTEDNKLCGPCPGLIILLDRPQGVAL